MTSTANKIEFVANVLNLAAEDIIPDGTLDSNTVKELLQSSVLRLRTIVQEINNG